MAYLVGALVARRRPVTPERRRAAMRAALSVYAGRLRRFYGLSASRSR